MRLTALYRTTLLTCLLGSVQAITAAPAPAQAILAGGCFWCLERDLDKLEGVLSTTSGYIGGHLPDPTYEQVSAGGSGHIEAVRIEYDPERLDYQTLLDYFWPQIDPLNAEGQFCDIGSQYRSAIFYGNEEERRLAEASREALQRSARFKQPIATDILPIMTFYPAEDYHQDYASRNPLRYHFYRQRCGRDARLQELWGQRPVD